MNEFNNEKNIHGNNEDNNFVLDSNGGFDDSIQNNPEAGNVSINNTDASYQNTEKTDAIDNSCSEELQNRDSLYCSESKAETDSLYVEKPVSSEEPRTGEFYTTTTKPYKKKKYMSVKAAAISLVCTAVVSVVSGVALSGIMFEDFLSKTNKNITSVHDNINLSYENSYKKVPQASLNGDLLTTSQIVDKVGPAVVGIINKTTYGNAYGFYGSLYGNLDDEIEQSSGSGVIISSDGYIVTNNHVVENASALTVILNNGEEYTAKIVGRDQSTDLAVIKIDGKDLVFAQMGSSSDLRVGEVAVAIGNPLGQEFAGTTTQGIISGLNRSVTVDNKTMNLIQTDAAINPGNSGGALVNGYGHLIGINTIKISSETLEGLGFAIPIDEAKPIIKELMTNGYVTGRPIIGIGGRAVTEDDAKAYNMKVGVYVSSMTPNGPAYMSGVKIGDIIVECEGEPIETVDDINEIKNKMKPGDELSIKVYRKGVYVDLKIILGEESPTE